MSQEAGVEPPRSVPSPRDRQGPREAGPGRAGRAPGTDGAERIPWVKIDLWCSEAAVTCPAKRQTDTFPQRFSLSLKCLGMLSLPCPGWVVELLSSPFRRPCVCVPLPRGRIPRAATGALGLSLTEKCAGLYGSR